MISYLNLLARELSNLRLRLALLRCSTAFEHLRFTHKGKGFTTRIAIICILGTIPFQGLKDPIEKLIIKVVNIWGGIQLFVD